MVAGQELRNSLPHTDVYLQDVYKKTKNSLKNRSKKDNVSWTKAKKLEAFLNLIKSTQKQVQGTGSIQFSEFWSKAEQISLIKELNATNPDLFKNSELLFLMGYDHQTQHMAKGVTSEKLGEYLEHGINRLIKTFQANITNKDYKSLSDFRVGAGQRQFNMDHLIQRFGRETLAELFNETSDAMFTKGYKETSGHSFQTKVWGKIDNTGLRAELHLEGLTGIKADIAECLRNATFTAKNYISSNDIKLGQTNPFRVFLTIPGFKQDIQRWHRMINCFKSHENTHSEAPEYFYRIRLIYELTGFGGYYSVDTQNEFGKILSGQTYAQYLIFNTHKGAGQIKVVPTKDLINLANVLDKEEKTIQNKTWEEAMYGVITLKQNIVLGY